MADVRPEQPHDATTRTEKEDAVALFTARMNDPHLCETHGPAPLPDGALSVKVNSLPTVRVGDGFNCGGCANRVQTGASTVTFRGEFAARLTDKSDHGGRIVIGSGNVVIGGPTGMGCIGAGKSTCQAMAAGRKSGEIHQSYGNCMEESLRQIIRRAKGKEITEEELMAYVTSDEPPLCIWTPWAPRSRGEESGAGRASVDELR